MAGFSILCHGYICLSQDDIASQSVLGADRESPQPCFPLGSCASASHKMWRLPLPMWLLLPGLHHDIGCLCCSNPLRASPAFSFAHLAKGGVFGTSSGSKICFPFEAPSENTDTPLAELHSQDNGARVMGHHLNTLVSARS